ncbi:MAG: ComEC/Rec2 family competence protein [Actinobacteria bacterium]|nr:ComEC/Rec2 family competence protein [Actinomycetota bacterium]
MTPDDSGDRFDVRLVPAAVSGWAATAAGILWGVGAAAAAVLTVAAATAGAARWARARAAPAATAGIGAVLGGVVVGAGFTVAIGLRVDDLREHPLVTRYGTSATVIVTPTESPRPVGAGRLMFRAALDELDGDEISGRVVVFGSAAGFAEVTAGRPAGFRARIDRPRRRDLTVAVLTAAGRPTLGEASAIDRAAHRVRAGFAESARRVLPADQASILPALVLGDTSTVSGQTTADFRASGLAHLTAVSGANVTIVCGAVLAGAALVGPRAAVALAAVALIAFVVVVQPSASVLRAAAMGAVTLLAVLSHRPRQAIPALSASVIALIVVVPALAVDVGFALSVSATAALVVVAPRWSRRLTARDWPKPLADAVSVAAAAQLATAPLIAGVSGTFSVVSVVANIAVAVVIPPITVIGTAAAALGVLWPQGAQLLIRFTGPEVWWLLRVAGWAAGVPGASIPVPSGAVGALLLAVTAGVVLMTWRRRWFRLGAAAVVVCLIAWTLSGAVGWA